VEVGTESARPLSRGGERTFPALVEPTDFSIKLSRSVCYGTCPAIGHVVWSAPPAEDIFPLVDRLLAAGAGRKELTRALADVCDKPVWRGGLVQRGADSAVCSSQRK
jgi:hypothetical protein